MIYLGGKIYIVSDYWNEQSNADIIQFLRLKILLLNSILVCIYILAILYEDSF